ncbi:MAG: ABC transporter permease subunit [Lachnospiraceae bacterium]|nr:ABC transporter permease subunit [Lachnospiraceae bacterium]
MPTEKKKKNYHLKNHLETAAILLFWILVWQAASMVIANDIFLPSPLEVAKALFGMLKTASFYRTIETSFLRITAGFVLGFLSAVLLSFLGFFLPFLHRLISPVLTVMKTVPVAAFVILFLVWSGSKHLSVWVAFFVTLPLLYQNIYTGLKQTDPELMEVAEVFDLPLHLSIRHLYFEAAKPYMQAGCRTAVGMSFKAGVAGEVICAASGTIGEGLYLSKIYLATDELFAWTIVIIVLSVFLEKVISLLFPTE